MTTEPSLADKVVALGESLNEARIPYAIGGALALAYYAEPRVTIDIDLNVFVGVDRLDELLLALPDGVQASDEQATALHRDGQARLWWDDTPVDVLNALVWPTTCVVVVRLPGSVKSQISAVATADGLVCGQKAKGSVA